MVSPELPTFQTGASHPPFAFDEQEVPVRSKDLEWDMPSRAWPGNYSLLRNRDHKAKVKDVTRQQGEIQSHASLTGGVIRA